MTNLVIGLTGGIASGKSAVAEMFAKRSVPIIDTDQLARELSEPNQPAFHTIVNHFGQAILHDDRINKRKLKALIFNDLHEKKWLEQLLHPAIRERIQQDLSNIHYPYCIVAIPLLAEHYPHPLIDRILVVDCKEETQLKRLLQREKIAEELAKKIISSQASRQARLKIADDVINNDGSLEDLEKKVEALHQFYLKQSTSQH